MEGCNGTALKNGISPECQFFSFFLVLRDIKGFNHDVLGFVEYTGPPASDFFHPPLRLRRRAVLEKSLALGPVYSTKPSTS